MTSACSKHYATAATHDKPVSAHVAAAVKIDTASLRDSLIGTWQISKTEIEQAVEKMSTYGSQAEKDEMLRKQKQYQESLAGMTTTFKSDMTYQSTYSGQSDIGTWRISRSKDIEAFSKVSGNASSFKVLSLQGGILIVRYDAAEMGLLLTFLKKQ